MFSHAKSLVFLLPILYFAIQYLAKPLVTRYFSLEFFNRFRNVAFILFIAYFVLPSYFLFLIFLAVVLWRFKFEEPIERIYLYVFLAVLIPVGPQFRLSLGPIQTLMVFDQFTVLSLVLLWPLVRQTVKDKGFFYGSADFYVLGYYTLVCILSFRGVGITVGARTALQTLIVFFLPYIAISRFTMNKAQIDRTLVILVMALLPVAAIAIFEAARSWQIVGDRTSFMSGHYFRKEFRAGLLRAKSIYFAPITLGTAMMLLIGILMYLSSQYKTKLSKYGAIGLSLGGSIASFSRMPWIATVLVFILQTVFNKGVFRLILSSVLVLALALAFVKFTPIGERVAGLIPFTGGETENQETVDYRSQLIEVGLDVASENLMFGTPFFLENPKMEVMRQGQGIIDLVNTHLTVLLFYGAVTLAFFWLMFLVPTLKAGFSIVINRKVAEDTRRLAILLCSLTAGQMANLISMSNIDAIPIFYTITLALTVSLLTWHRLENEKPVN